MHKTTLGLAIASLALLPVAGQAADIGYSFVQAAYVSTDFDDFDETADGFVLSGSIEVAENFFIYADYADQSLDFDGRDVDATAFSVGGGYAYPVSESMDLVGSIGYVSAETHGFDDDGYELAVGLRAMAMEQLELNGSIGYVDLSDSGDSTALSVGALWYFLPQFALGASVGFSDDADSYGIGVRWDFGGN
jgi:hypothetical protein